jgi:hypothetical protein
MLDVKGNLIVPMVTIVESIDKANKVYSPRELM